MKRQPLSVVSNSQKATENRTMSGRTRKPPKRFIEDEVGNAKENSVSKQKKVERKVGTRSKLIDVKDGRKKAENIAPSKNTVNSRKAKMNITSNTDSLKPSNMNKESEPKNSDKKTPKILEAVENEKTLVCSKTSSVKETLSHKATQRRNMIQSSEKNGSFVAKRTRSNKVSKLDSKIQRTKVETTSSSSGASSNSNKVKNKPVDDDFQKEKSSTFKGKRNSAKRGKEKNMANSIHDDKESSPKTTNKQQNNLNEHPTDKQLESNNSTDQTKEKIEIVVMKPGTRKRRIIPVPDKDSEKTNKVPQKGRKGKFSRLDSEGKVSEKNELKDDNSEEINHNNHHERSTVNSNGDRNSKTKVDKVKCSPSNNDQLEKSAEKLIRNSEKGDLQKQNLSLKADAIAQMLEDDDDEYSDVDSEDDVPNKDLSQNRPLQDCSNLPMINTEISKETSSHLPIYKQDKVFRVPLAVNNQIPVRNSKNRIGQDKNKEENMSSLRKEKINVSNITKENIYEMDADPDIELGYTAEVPKNKKNAGKKNKKQANKQRVNRTETKQSKPKNRNISIRVASSSTDLKRSFFENNMFALNLISPEKKHKKSTVKVTSKSMKKNDVSTLKEQSSEKVQTSLFHEVANQPEARQWVEQVRVANKQLNQSLFSSVEYDGDAFMPSVVGATVGEDYEVTNNPSLNLSSKHVSPKQAQKSSLEKPVNAVENEFLLASPIENDNSPIAEKINSPPKTLKQEIDLCFGFGDSDMSEDYEDMEENNVRTLDCSSDISPNKSSGLLSPPNEPLNGYLNSTQASIPSPTRRKQHIVPLDVSRIPNRSTYNPCSNPQLLKPTSRFEYKNIRTKVASNIASSANILPRSMYNLSPSCNNRSSTTSNSNFVVPKEAPRKVHQPAGISDKNKCYDHPQSSQPDHTSAKDDVIATNLSETRDQNQVLGLDVEDEQELENNKNSENDQPDNSKTSIDAFALLRMKQDSKSKNNHRKKETRKANTTVSKPSKIQKQTLIYETDGETKKLKAPKSKKQEMQSVDFEERPNKSSSANDSRVKKVYTKRPKENNEHRRKTKAEKEMEQWETLQSSHFEEIGDVELSFL